MPLLAITDFVLKGAGKAGVYVQLRDNVTPATTFTTVVATDSSGQFSFSGSPPPPADYSAYISASLVAPLWVLYDPHFRIAYTRGDDISAGTLIVAGGGGAGSKFSTDAAGNATANSLTVGPYTPSAAAETVNGFYIVAGIVGDGVTAETTNLNRALARAFWIPAAAGGTVRVPFVNTGVVLIDGALLIPANTKLVLDKGVTIKAKAAWAGYMVQAAGQASATRTAGIEIEGGIWDCNQANRTASGTWITGPWVGHAFDLQKVDDCNIHDLKIINAFKWAIAVADFTNLKTTSISLDTPSDGIHVLGPGTGWTCRDCSGVTGDDMLGISTVEWPGYAVSEGNVTGVLLSNIRPNGSRSALRILGGTGTYLSDITVENIKGTIATLAGSWAAIYANDDQQNPGRAGTDVRGLVIRDIELTTLLAKPIIQFGATAIRDVSISKVRFGANSTNCVQVDSGTIGNLKLDDVLLTSGTSSKFLAINGGTVSHVEVSGLRSQSTASTGAVGVYVGNVTVTDLTADDIELVGNTSVGLDIESTTAIPTVSLSRFRSLNASSTSITGVKIGATATVTSLFVDQIRMLTSASSGIGVQMDGTVTKGSVHRAYMDGPNSTVYLTGGASSYWDVRDIYAVNGQDVFKTKIPVNVSLTDIEASTSSAILALFTAPASPVRVYGGSWKVIGGATISRDGAQLIYLSSPTIQCDFALLAQTLGDTGYNTNVNTTPFVLGPAISDGTTWRPFQDLGKQTPTETVLVSGVNAAGGTPIQVTLTAARVVGVPLNPRLGQRLTFTFVQGGAGAWAVTWNAVFKKTWVDTGNATGARSSISYYWDGTNWNQDGAQSPYV